MKVVVRAMCAALVVVPSFFSSAPARAQVTATAPVSELPQYNNRWEVYGGAQYSHFNPSPGRNVQATNLLGWNGTASVFLHSRWGIEASARGLYGSMSVPANAFNIPTSPKMSEYLFLFGPTVRILRGENYAAGMHALIGAAYGSFDKDFPSGVQPDVVDIYNNKLAVGGAVGAWGDRNLSSRLAVRLVADWQPTKYGFTTQNEFAGSVGIVYKFGVLHR
ncbi:MAG TPA: hypothetical protein VFW25_13915 [Silvibacterium sp.]|nr:hypothetical protein [Silvibacterium sp.]